MPGDAQDKWLLVTLLDYQTPTEQIDAFLDAWTRGDLNLMEERSNRSYKEHPGLEPFNKMLLDQRNIPMANKIDQLSKSGIWPHFLWRSARRIWLVKPGL